MKKALVVIGVVLVVASVASAQSARKFGINVGGGLSMPMGDFGDAAGIGFHADGSLMWDVAPKIKVGPAVSYHILGSDFDGADGSFGILMFGGDIQYLFSEPMATTTGGSKMMPFLIGGLGFASTSTPDFKFGDETISGESSSDFFISIGVGANMGKWFGKVRWVNIMSDPSASMIPFTVGLRF